MQFLSKILAFTRRMFPLCDKEADRERNERHSGLDGPGLT